MKPKRMECFVAENATVLHIITQNVQAKSKAMSAMQVAQRVIDIYSCVGQATANHGISHVEYRTDSFVCLLDLDDPICNGDPVEHLLAFAADLHQRLANLDDPLQAHMGMASGATALIGTTPAVVGAAANIADDLASLGIPAAVAVHDSALWRWASAARRSPPPAPPVECASGRCWRVAVFDLGSGSFRPAAVPATLAALRQSVSVA
jgi:class 3 adenylate cyclase